MSLAWLRHHARHRNRGTTLFRRGNQRLTAKLEHSQFLNTKTYAPRVTYDNSFVVDSSVTFRDAEWASDDQYKRQYHRLGWEITSIRQDGNCLFRALSDQLYGHERRHLELRRRLVDFIDLERAFFEPFVGGEGVVKYCARLRVAGVWGGHTELVAASRLLGVNIIVHVGPVKRLRIDCDKSTSTKEGKDKIINLLLKTDHYNSLRKKKVSHEQQHGCSGACLCKRIVTPSRASLASLGDCPSDLASSSCDRSLDHSNRNSLPGRPLDNPLDQRGRLKGAYGRKPVPDALNSSSNLITKRTKAPIKPKSRPPPPPKKLKDSAVAPPCPVVPVEQIRSTSAAPTISKMPAHEPSTLLGKSKVIAQTSIKSTQSAPRAVQKSPGVVLFQPETSKSDAEVKIPLVVLFEPDQSQSKPVLSKISNATPEKFTALAVKENEEKLVSGNHDTVPHNAVRRPRRAVFKGGKRRRSSVAALSLLQEVSMSLNVSAPEVKLEPKDEPVEKGVEPVVKTVEPVHVSLATNRVTAAKPNSPMPRVQIKKSSKKVFRQGRPVPTAC